MWAEVYYPAASLYKAACLTFNFGPTFAFPPLDAEMCAAVSSLAEPIAAEPEGADAGEEGGEGGEGGELDEAMEDAEADGGAEE